MKLGVMVLGLLRAIASLGDEKEHSGLRDDAMSIASTPGRKQMVSLAKLE